MPDERDRRLRELEAELLRPVPPPPPGPARRTVTAPAAEQLAALRVLHPDPVGPRRLAELMAAIGDDVVDDYYAAQHDNGGSL